MSDKSKLYFEATVGTRSPVLDDLTAADLEVDRLFEFLDSSRSTPGRAVLYAWLRVQCLDSQALEDRRTLVQLFRRHPEMRRSVENVLLKLGSETQGNIVDFLWKDNGSDYVDKAPIFRVLVIAELMVFLASLTLGLASLMVLVVLSVINLGVYLKTTKYIGKYTHSISYLARMLVATRKLAKAVGSGSTDDHKSLEKGAGISTRIPFTIALFLPSANLAGDLASAFFEYYRIFLLGEIRAYFSFQKAQGQHHEEIKKAFELVGKMDSSLCILDVEDSGPGVSLPVFSNRPHLLVSALVHPLVTDFVPLSVSIEKGAIVTGTNMAGKSTFLRTIGINQVLATTIGIVFAEKYESCFARVLTALEISDDLDAGKSRYLAQAERILEVVTTCEQGRVLALIDEILSGTNSRDRIRASIAILRHLASTGSIVVASTHDLEIAEAIRDLYQGLYFAERLDEKGLVFDYKIHQGIVDRSNAFRILQHLGFSKYLREVEST